MYGTRKTYPFIPDDGDQFAPMRAHYRYTSADIMHFALKFIALEQAILEFHNRFAAAYPAYRP
jgi:hypothetical protein